MLSEQRFHYIIVVLTLAVLILASILVFRRRKAAEHFRIRASVMSGAASQRFMQLNPGFGGQLGTMENAPPMANLTAQPGEMPLFDFDEVGRNVYTGQLTDMALYLGQSNQRPYVKNLPM